MIRVRLSAHSGYYGHYATSKRTWRMHHFLYGTTELLRVLICLWLLGLLGFLVAKSSWDSWLLRAHGTSGEQGDVDRF